ncbi:membrane-associated kinase regulator [Vigna angularis]|uniref:Membrane-associated kinase regulator n=3 Tax=Phaseolus angularis TaxID=3914 RepID=A0A8T0JJ23_PHAAN|nr:probable membrane-associated kinase regulator 1 [Vigna angularis]KAG2375469.1 membrane-associated kinase regulator [Vigna angularis]
MRYMNERTEMGRRRGKESKSYTLPSSPSHSFSSSSSSDFEFTISISPRKSSTALCPADELFYKGQLLPLHLSQRISMVRTLLLSSASTSSTSTAARDSTGSSSNDSHSSFTSDLALFPDCDSSRPSSVTEEDEFKRLNNSTGNSNNSNNHPCSISKKSHKFFFSRFSSVFRKENNLQAKTRDLDSASANSSVKRMSVTAREVIRKYFKKVKPLYEKLSQKQQRSGQLNTAEGASAVTTTSVFSLLTKTERSTKLSEGTKTGRKDSVSALSHSFSGNLRYPRRRSCVSSCPSSMRSSPNHSGVLSQRGAAAAAMYCGDTSSMEELQSAIQGAIAHCKNSLIQSKTMVSNEI